MYKVYRRHNVVSCINERVTCVTFTVFRAEIISLKLSYVRRTEARTIPKGTAVTEATVRYGSSCVHIACRRKIASRAFSYFFPCDQVRMRDMPHTRK